ncbi:MAG: asparagine synthase (glutamine-hydrolyzing) [Acidobacteria bacterium]|nr:asparagine synthase (glutamine-hydrolyzing) [Acidobacteriota bacterium]
MCGISGFVNVKGDLRRDCLLDAIHRMTDALSHRGPDDEGYWIDDGGRVALGHRRLSILDLSPLGHQPMESHTGRYVISFNGEVYNFPELRRELEQGGDTVFRGTYDTEVMLACFEKYGVASAVKRFNGMFAFALWDRQERALYLARDRFGEKPLYYGWIGREFVFGSELKALRAYPGFRGEIDADVMPLYFRHNYVPAPFSIYKGIWKLEPACWLRLPEAATVGTLPETVRYWSAEACFDDGQAQLDLGEEEAVDELQKKLRDCVRARMVSDVPIGAFLSGGIDSSVVVAMMQESGMPAARTFTIGFHDQNYNEAGYSRAVAKHLGTHHTELTVTPAEAMATIPNLASIYDEPFADASQIPTTIVSSLARRAVSVVLTGDGGDEVFGGYTRYFWAHKLWRVLGGIPLPVRASLNRLGGVVPPVLMRLAGQIGESTLPSRYRIRNLHDKLHRLRSMLLANSAEEVYLQLISGCLDSEALTRSHARMHWAGEAILSHPSALAAPAPFMLLDIATYLPDDILVKVDRAAMSVGLEGRSPLLDPDLLAFVGKLPPNYRVRNGQGKWILRQVLSRYLPKQMFERSKAGFAVPLQDWLRGGLRSWADDLFACKSFACNPYLNTRVIRQKWEEHRAGKANWTSPLWCALMFQAWLGNSLEEPSPIDSTVAEFTVRGMPGSIH